MRRDIPIDEVPQSSGSEGPEEATERADPQASGDAAGGPAAGLDGSQGVANVDGANDGSETDPPVQGDTQEGDEPTVAAGDASNGGSDDRLAALREEVATLNDQHLRLAAEFQNYRKRVNRERDQMRARSQAELVGVLLDALDDLERVTNVDPEAASAASLIEGVDLVERKLQRALEAAGAETIDAVGKRFDPETMEAIGALPTDDPEQDETVAMTFQRGYRMHGILVRPARVQVLKHGG